MNNCEAQAVNAAIQDQIQIGGLPKHFTGDFCGYYVKNGKLRKKLGEVNAETNKNRD